MTILGWMHRKFRGNESLREFSIGNPCTCIPRQSSSDDLQYYSNSNTAYKHENNTAKELRITNSFGGLESNYLEEDDYEDGDSSAMNSELFHGFLTIGTFGSDPTSTPTFSISVENVAEQETEVTEDDLKLINDELERVLGNEEDDETLERNSNASAITLAGKVIEGTDTDRNGPTVCPLQDYLFGSTVNLIETTLMRKENRTSLQELFQKSKVEEDNRDSKNNEGGKRKNKGNDKSALRLMKKFLKKTTVRTEKKVESSSAKEKLDKIRRIFSRKVYPEGSMAPRKSDKRFKNEINNNIKQDMRCNNGDRITLGDDTLIFPCNTVSKESKACFKNHRNLSEATANGRDYDGNREIWIKTDSDYLVLEL